MYAYKLVWFSKIENYIQSFSCKSYPAEILDGCGTDSAIF